MFRVRKEKRAPRPARSPSDGAPGNPNYLRLPSVFPRPNPRGAHEPARAKSDGRSLTRGAAPVERTALAASRFASGRPSPHQSQVFHPAGYMSHLPIFGYRRCHDAPTSQLVAPVICPRGPEARGGTPGRRQSRGTTGVVRSNRWGIAREVTRGGTLRLATCGALGLLPQPWPGGISLRLRTCCRAGILRLPTT